MPTKSPISPGTIQRIIATLFAGQSLMSAAMIAAFTLMPIIAAGLSGSDATAGFPSTMTLLGRAAAAYPVGVLMDRAGRRWGLTVGYGLGFLGSLVAVWAIMSGSFWWFCAAAFLMGMGRSSGDQSRYVAAEVEPEARRAKVIGLIVFAGTVGAIGGPLLVAPSQVLAEQWGYLADTGPYLVGVGMYVVAMVLTAALLRPDPKWIGQMLETAVTQVEVVAARAMRQIFRQPSVILAVAAMTIGQLVMGLIMVITPLNMNHQNHGTAQVSFVISAHTLGMYGLSGVTGWLIDRYGRVPLIVGGAVLLIVSSVLAAVVTALLPLAMTLFLLGLGWNFCFIAGSSLLSSSLAASERATAQGASEMMVALAAGLGGLTTGVIYGWGGMVAIAAAGLAFSLLLVALLAWYGAARRPLPLGAD
jgi:MFS family permease